MIKDNIKSSLKNIIRNKKNLSLLFILAILFILIIITLTFYLNFNNYLEQTINKNVGFRTISTSKEGDYNTIISEVKKIKNVKEAYNGKYKMFSTQSNINYNGLDGGVNLLYGTSNTIPPIVKGETLNAESEGVAICPYYFYPDAAAWNLKIDKNKLLNPDKLIGLEFEINYNSYKLQKNEMVYDKTLYKKFKIIGLYDNNKVMNPNDTCYISAKDLIEIRNSWMPFEEEDSSITIDILVDDSKNIEKVTNELEKIGFEEVSILNEIDTNFVEKINLLAILFLIIIITTTLIIYINFLFKKTKNDQKNIGILRACGYNKKQIMQKYLIENSIIITFSLIISTIFFYILFIMGKYIFLKPLFYLGFELITSPLSIILLYILSIGINMITSYIFVLKELKRNISDMIKEENI